MTILQIIQKEQLRGAQIFAVQLSNHLLDSGNNSIIVSLFPGDSRLPFNGRIFSLDCPIKYRFFNLKGWKHLSQIIHQVQPDIIQANAGDTLKFVVFSKLLFRWKTPVIFRNANKVSDFIDSGLKKSFNKFLVSNVSHVISVSDLCRLDFIRTYGVRQEKVSTVPIGIELTSENKVISNDIRDFCSSGKILLSVASFVPEKNHLGLLDILSELVQQGSNVKILFIGEGKLKPIIEEKIGKLKLRDRVMLAGYRKDVLQIMALADIFVLPSLIEGLPAVILEAMYCKTLVVANDVGGVSEVVRHGETGWLVTKGNEAEFAKTVRHVLEMDEGQLARIRERAYENVVSNFDNRIIAQRFLKVYRKVVSGS